MQPKLLRASRDFKKKHPFRTRFIKYFIYTVVPLLLIVAGSMMLFFQYEYQKYLTETVAHEGHLFQLKQREVHGMSTTLLSDIDLLADQYLTQREVDGWAANITKLFYRYMRHKPFYRQIRIIDQSGMEVVRSSAKYLKKELEEMLQSKRRRKYVQDGLKLKKDQYLLTRFDLNIERSIIEKPINPVVRLIKPLFKGDQRIGMVVINLSGRGLLNILGPDKQLGHYYLVDHTGGLVIAPDNKGVWEFLLNPNDGVRFFHENQLIWTEMIQKKRGYITSKKSIFIFDTIDWNLFSNYPKLTLEGPFLKQIIEIPITDLKKPIYALIGWLFLGGSIGVILIAFLITLFRIQKLIALDKLKQIAQIDPLTKLLNRRAFMEIFEAEKVRGRHLNQSFGVILGDLDRFKVINDDFGSDAGDQVIKSVAIAIKSVLRKGDIVCRWEGTSFMMLLPGISGKEGNGVVEKIRAKVEDIRINYQRRQLNVTMSMGMVICGEINGWDEVQCLRHLNHALYEAKNGGRNQVKIG